MGQYLLYDAAIKEWTASLSPWHSVLYALGACQRSAPLYYEFVEKEKWGDVEAFKTSHQLLEAYLFHTPPSMVDLEECEARVEQFTPSTEEFPGGVYACDAGIIHIYSLSLLKEFNPEHAYYIARYCYELVDCAVGRLILPKGGQFNPDVEQEIENHPLVQGELSWQSKGRQMISAIPNFDEIGARQFIKLWTVKPMTQAI